MLENTSCLTGCNNNKTCGLCGPNIEVEALNLTNQTQNLVYLDKVFSYNDQTGCPILANLNTGGDNAAKFVTELVMTNEGCPCSNCELDCTSVFNIQKSYVLVDYFAIKPATNISPCNVTVNGYPVDSITYSTSGYLANTAELLPKIERQRCLDLCQPTKTFLLMNVIGPWEIRPTMVLEGVVNTRGKNCTFKCSISMAENAKSIALPKNALASFAIQDFSMPCAVNGVYPDIRFQFDAKMELVNPVLTAADCGVVLTSTFAVEPNVHVEAVRQSLFAIEAREVIDCCDGATTQAEIKEYDCLLDLDSNTNCDCSCNGTSAQCQTNTGCGCCGGSCGGCGTTPARYQFADSNGCF